VGEVDDGTREQQFLALLLRWAGRDRHGNDAWVEWIAGDIRDGAVVVLSQWVEHRHGRYTTYPIDGRRFVLRDYSLAIYGTPEADIRDLAADAHQEILEPDGPGVLLEVPWADSLTPAPGEVHWHGDAVEQAARLGAP
jgi:hypothetical protein